MALNNAETAVHKLRDCSIFKNGKEAVKQCGLFRVKQLTTERDALKQQNAKMASKLRQTEELLKEARQRSTFDR